MTLREAAQQALEFIVALNTGSPFWLVPESNLNKTVTALRAALAEEAMQLPCDEKVEDVEVYWRRFYRLDGMYSYCTDDDGNVLHLAAWTDVEIVND